MATGRIGMATKRRASGTSRRYNRMILPAATWSRSAMRLRLPFVAAAFACSLACAAALPAPRRRRRRRAEREPAAPRACRRSRRRSPPRSRRTPSSARRPPSSWHPTRARAASSRARAGNVDAAPSRRSAAGARPRSSPTSPTRCGSALCWPKAPDTLVFARDTGGNEQRQLYRLDAGRERAGAADRRRRASTSSRGVTHARDRVLLDSTDVDKTGKRENPTTRPHAASIRSIRRARASVATLPGTGWGDFTFSFDDRRLAMIEYNSVNESYVWVMDVATGTRRRVLPRRRPTPRSRSRRAATSTSPATARGIFLATDRDGEFQQARATSTSRRGKLDYFGDGGNWDVEAIALSPDGRTLAVITNEGRRRRAAALRRRDAPRAAAPALPIGSARRLVVAREFARPRGHRRQRAEPGRRVRRSTCATTASTRWTETQVQGLDAAAVPRRRADRVEELRRPRDRRLHDPAAGEVHRQAAGDRRRSTAAPKARRGPASWAAGTTSSTSSASRSSSRTCAARPATARPSSRSTTA